MDQVLGRDAPFRGAAINQSPDPVLVPENPTDFSLSIDNKVPSV